MSDREVLNTVRKELERIGQNARQLRKLDAFGQVFQKVDRIISGRPVKFEILKTTPSGMGWIGNCPAFTDGETIWINGPMLLEHMKVESLEDVVRKVKSLNMHELSHVLFTPRKTSEILRWLKNEAEQGWGGDWRRNVHRAFNILEDQRIETLFTGLYRPAVPYFTLNVLTWVTKNAQKPAQAAPFIYGRRFLDAGMRKEAMEGFRDQYGVLADELSDIIDQYVLVQYPVHNGMAKTLTERFARLLTQIDMVDQQAQEEQGGHMDKGMEQGEPDKDQQQAAQQAAQQAFPNQPEDEEDEEEGQGGAQGQESDEDEQEGTQGQGEGQEDAQDAENDEQGDDSQDDAQEPQEGQGAGNQDDDADPVEDFIDQALRELEKVLNDEQFINDVRDTAKAIHEAMEGQDLEPDAERLGGRDIAVDVETQRTAQRMQDNFRQLRLQLEETHLHNQTAGRIDPRRFMTRKPWEVDFFKAFDPGHYDDTSIELVILVDQSGSMRRRELDVAQTVWTIRQSLQPLDARITVLGFATHGYVMALPSDRAHPKMTKVHNCMGGTKPDESIRQAYRIMESSQRSLKIMLTLTDGDWAGDVVRTERYVQAMNEMGVLTGLVFIGGVADPARHQHEHIIFQGANDVASLVKMSEAIVRMSMSKMADQMITA